MTTKPDDADAPDPQASPDYEVGYGKPPVGTRFQPGRSGNPRGRPRGGGAKSGVGILTADELLRRELYRTVTVRENGKAVKLPVFAAIIRANVQAAAKGSRLHLKALMDPLRATEARHSAMQGALLEQALDTKELWKKRQEEHAARNLLPPQPPLPHPDDINVDVRRGVVQIDGPTTEAERAVLENTLRQRDLLIHDYQTAIASLADFPDPALADEVRAAEAEIAGINATLPQRYRRTL